METASHTEIAYSILEAFGIDKGVPCEPETWNELPYELREAFVVQQRAVAWRCVLAHIDACIKLFTNANLSQPTEYGILTQMKYIKVNGIIREMFDSYDIRKTIIENKIENWSK